MIRVGFILSVSKEWMGGVNYYKNLLFALSTVKEKELEIFVFCGKNVDIETKEIFREHATLVEDSIFDRKSLRWLISKIENKLLKTNYLLGYMLKSYDIKVISHSRISHLTSIRSIEWIPDFQHVHLPDMFSEEDISRRDSEFMELITKSDRMVLSSYDALKDYTIFAPEYIDKASVLQFVSQPDIKYDALTDMDKIHLQKKYNIKDNFFYLPNQFWKHKNHMVAFEAVKLLAMEGVDICLVCTGHLGDYRNKEYIDEIHGFIKNHQLEDSIKLLGLVDYEDVFSLMKFSKAVINPSLFEGWSSTVEECKSVGKNMILSDLEVHREQYPEAKFFARESAESLKNILKDYSVTQVDLQMDSLQVRTERFAYNYVDLVKKVAKNRLIDNK